MITYSTRLKRQISDEFTSDVNKEFIEGIQSVPKTPLKNPYDK